MPKLATRRVYFAALAVPIAMVIAPLTASAGVPDEAVMAEQEHADAIETDWYEPANIYVAYDDADDANVTYVINGIHNDSVTGNYQEDAAGEDGDADFSPGPDWYHDVNVTYDDSDDVNVTYVVNGIHNDSVTGNYQEAAGHDENAYADEDEDVVLDYGHDVDSGHDLDEWADDDSAAGATYSNVNTGAGSGGVWFNYVESGAFTQNDSDFGHDGDDFSAGYFDELTAAAGDGGAFAESTESEFVEQD